MSILLLASLASATPLVIYELEDDDGGFLESGETGAWAWGDVTHGPASGFDGARAWSTGLVADYLNDTTDYIEIPVPALGGVARPMMSFQHWYEISPGDSGWIEVDSGNGWDPVTPLYGYPVGGGFTGASGGWRTVVVDLTGYSDMPRVRLAFSADLSGVSAGWTVDHVAFHDGDVAAPQLSDLTVLTDTEDLTGPYTVEVTAQDDTVVAAMTLHWRVAGTEGSVDMACVSGDTWTGEIPAQLPDTDVSYWVEASDGLNDTREPLDDELSFRVYLPAPTGLAGPLERVVGLDVPLTWTAPVTSHEVLGYEVLRGGVSVLEVDETSADAPLLGGGDTFSVRAVYAEGVGDESDPVLVDAVIPLLHALSPAEAWPGETVRVRIVGEYLLLVGGEVTLNVGSDIQIGRVDVRNVDTAYVDLTLDAEATSGLRTVTLKSGDVTLTVDDAFEVLVGDERPRLVGVEPETLRQGESGELVITHVGDFASVPTVELGSEVVVDSVVVEPDGLLVRYTVATDAALGERVVTVDDGVRVFEGATLEVADARTITSRGCGTPTAPGAGLVLVGLAAIVRRRNRG